VNIDELLLGDAGLALSLAGFSGLVIAVRTAGAIQWQPRDIWSLAWMLGSSMSGLFLALLPILLETWGASEAVSWTSSNAVMATAMALWGVAMNRYDRQLMARGFPARVKYFPMVAFLLFEGTALANVLAVLALVPRTGAFILGLTVSLLAASLALVVFLVILGREASGPTSRVANTVVAIKNEHGE
jgi:hypothetical protein